MNDPKFNVGDEVVLATGKSVQTVMQVCYFSDKEKCYRHKGSRNKPWKEGWYIRAMYPSKLSWAVDYHNLPDFRAAENSENWERWRHEDDYNLVTRKELELTEKLYQTLEEKARFGTFLSYNSKGQIVLEMKGKDGDVETFDRDKVEEVMPYTVKLVEMVKSSGMSPDTMIITAQEGQLAVDDVLIDLGNSTMYRVTAVNTKDRQAKTRKKSFAKLTTETIVLNDE